MWRQFADKRIIDMQICSVDIDPSEKTSIWYSSMIDLETCLGVHFLSLPSGGKTMILVFVNLRFHPVRTSTPLRVLEMPRCI